MSIKTNIKNKKTLTVLILIIVAGLLFFGYKQFIQKDSSTADVPIDQNSGINYTPPTEAEKEETEQHKKDLDSQNENDNKSSSLKTVVPVITSYGQGGSSAEVGSRVPGVIESNGTCTLTMKKGDKKVTQSQSATENVSETSCGFITISNDRLSKGNWSAQITYKSPKAKGFSETVTIEIK